MHSPLTEHARTRMQQRGFDKRSRLRALRILGRESYRQLERCFNAYAVVAGDDAVVTVGYRR